MKTPRILIVEDDPIVAWHQSLTIQDLGYELAGVANSAESAVEKFEETNPDLVLMDIVLDGEVDGIEAAQQIRSRQDAAIVFVTAHTDAEFLERAKVTQPLGYLTKPVSKESLRCAVEIALHRSKNERELLKAYSDLERLIGEGRAKLRDTIEQLKRETARRLVVETETSRQNSFLNSVLESLPHPFYVIDANDYTIELANRAASLAGIAVGTKCYAGSHGRTSPCSSSEHPCPLLEVKRTRRPLIVEHVHYAHKVNPRHIEIHAYPIMSAEGEVSQIIEYAPDITERKEAEKEKESLKQQLFHAQKMEAIGTFAGGIAHDFNNLLQIVLGYSDILIMKKGNESADIPNLETIRKAAKDGRYLAKALLTFSRKSPSNLRSVSLNRQLRAFKAILERMIPKTIEIKLDLAADLKAVHADPIQVEQILMNLATNAHQAMANGGKLTFQTRNVILDEALCSTSPEAKPGEYTMLKVSDTGQGMAQDVLERIFDPFFSTKEAGIGTGLGLSIVYGIVRNHSGIITCTSEPGEGSTFSIHLPAIPGEYVPNAVTRSAMMNAFGTEAILVVDDEEPIRIAVGGILRACGFKVFEAENGNKALEIYRDKEDEIDLVILDLNMLGMTGTQCLDAILKIDPGAKVLISSGFPVDEPTRRMLDVCTSGFLSKPFDAEDLVGAVRRALDETGSPEDRVTGAGSIAEQNSECEKTADAAMGTQADFSPAHEAPHIVASAEILQILAIDDREPFLRMLEMGFAQLGHKSLTALSGAEGLRLFDAITVNLVVCDLGLPDLDGWAVGKRIKEICQHKGVPKTPFVLLTGLTDMEDMRQRDAERMTECGVDAILGKPIDIEDILKVAHGLTDKK